MYVFVSIVYVLVCLFLISVVLLQQGRGGAPRYQASDRKLKTLEAKALDTLGLNVSSTPSDIKTRYKELVKRHHPDANGGDRASEERFRAVIEAYKLLKQAGFC